MRRVSIFALVLLSVLGATQVGIASAYEHVHNGSFETGTDGWFTSPSASPSTDHAYDGSRSARLVLADRGGELSYAVPAALPIGSYDVSVQLLTDTAGVTALVSLVTAHNTPATTVALTPNAWNGVSLSATLAIASNATLKVRISGPPGAVAYVDDARIDGAAPVTLTPTPTATPPPDAAVTGETPTAIATPTPFAERVDAPAAHLRNPGFEEVGADGLPFAWQKYGGTLATSGRARSGANAARLDSNTPSTKWLYQTVLVEPGATYAFGAWILHDDPNVEAAFLRVSWYASPDGSGSAIATADSPDRLTSTDPSYRHITTGPVTAPVVARSANLRIMLAPRSGAAASIHADDASFGPASPLPPTPAPSDDSTAAAAPSRGESRSSARQTSSRTNRSSSVSGNALIEGPYATTSPILINEVLYDSIGDGNDADGEWIELYNVTDHPVSLDGWSIQDNSRRTMLPAIDVPAHGFAVVAATDLFLAQHPGFTGAWASVDARLGNGLGNDGDTLELLDPAGAVADAISWGDDTSVFDPAIPAVPAGHSVERRSPGADSDTAADFLDNHAPSPGLAIPPDVASQNGAAPQTRTVEILDGAASAGLEWLPWAFVALSGTALAGSVGWRAYEAARHRARSA